MSMAFLQEKNVLGLNQLNGQMTHSLGDQHCGETVMEKSHGDCGLEDVNPEIVDTGLFPPKNGLISEANDATASKSSNHRGSNGKENSTWGSHARATENSQAPEELSQEYSSSTLKNVTPPNGTIIITDPAGDDFVPVVGEQRIITALRHSSIGLEDLDAKLDYLKSMASDASQFEDEP